MNTFAWFGAVVGILTLVIILCSMVCVILDKVHRQWEAWLWAQRRLAFHEVGKRVLCETYYFRRSPEAVLAIEALGETLRDSDGWRLEQVDELWERKLSDYKSRKDRELEAARKLVAEADKA